MRLNWKGGIGLLLRASKCCSSARLCSGRVGNSAMTQRVSPSPAREAGDDVAAPDADLPLRAGHRVVPTVEFLKGEIIGSVDRVIDAGARHRVGGVVIFAEADFRVEAERIGLEHAFGEEMLEFGIAGQRAGHPVTEERAGEGLVLESNRRPHR